MITVKKKKELQRYLLTYMQEIGQQAQPKLNYVNRL